MEASWCWLAPGFPLPRDRVMHVPCHAPAPGLVTYKHREFLMPLYSQFCQHFIKPDQKQRGLRKPPFPPPSSARVWKSCCSLWCRLRGVELGQGKLRAGPGRLDHPLPCRKGSQIWSRAGSRTSPAVLSPGGLPSPADTAGLGSWLSLNYLPRSPLSHPPSTSVPYPHPVLPEYIQMYRGFHSWGGPLFPPPSFLPHPFSPPQGPTSWSVVLPGHQPGGGGCAQEEALCKAAGARVSERPHPSSGHRSRSLSLGADPPTPGLLSGSRSPGGDPRRSPRLLGPFVHSTILASEVFKEASWGAVGVVVIGEQAAGTPAFSPAPAWAGTLQGEKGGGQGEMEWSPQASHRQPSLVRGGQRLPEPHPGGLGQRLWGDSVLGDSAGCILILTCSFSS